VNRAIPIGILTIIAVVCACGGSGDHPTAVIHAHVAPRQPLRHAACMSEMRGWGYSVGAARQFGCSERISQAPWFHATFTNVSAPGTYIHCAFTAWDANGRQLFHGWLPLAEVSMPAGVYLNPHQARSIDWYFDAQAYPTAIRHAGAVARYTSFCTPWDNPPI
jgi:hypothetical protein